MDRGLEKLHFMWPHANSATFILSLLVFCADMICSSVLKELVPHISPEAKLA